LGVYIDNLSWLWPGLSQAGTRRIARGNLRRCRNNAKTYAGDGTVLESPVRLKLRSMMYTNYIDYNLFLRVANAEFQCATPVLRMASALEVQAPGAPVTFSDLQRLGSLAFDFSTPAGVDSTKNPALNKRFGIHGYPTLLMLTDEGKEMRRLFNFEIEKK